MLNNEADVSTTFAYFALCAVVMSNVLGNVFIKFGSSVGPKQAIMFGFGWQTFVGICFFASGVLLYAWALKLVPLYVAQTIAALQYVGNILAASVIFGEPITPKQWIGIVLICTGLGVINR